MANALDRLAPRDPVVEAETEISQPPTMDLPSELPESESPALAPVAVVPEAPRRKVARAPRKPRQKKEDR
jgi:hypothetical protein